MQMSLILLAHKQVSNWKIIFKKSSPYIYRWRNSWHPFPHHLWHIGGPEGVVGLTVIIMHGRVEGGVDA